MVVIEPLAAAGRAADADSQGRAGTGGAAVAGAGGSREGSAGGPRVPPPPGCNESTELELDEEHRLREAFIEAYNSGSYCPNLSDAERRTLVPDRDLDWRARATGCWTVDSANWFHVSPRTPVMAWVLLGTPSLEDAKKALLTGEHTELCEEAERTPLRYVGVGHLGEAWAVIVAPGPPDDMQKP
jgi:hypothetical protein